MDRTYPQIGLLHHVGGGNLGDDATLQVFIQNVKRRWPNAIITAISMNPDDTCARHGIPSYPIRRQTWTLGRVPARPRATFKEAIKTLARVHPILWYFCRGTYTVGIRAPMELVGELSFLAASRRVLRSLDLLVFSGGGQLIEIGGPWKFPYTLFKWMALAKSIGVRCMVVNVGAGPLRGGLSKVFIKWTLRAADYVSFRDVRSLMLAHDIGFTGNGTVFPDTAYGFEVSSVTCSLSSSRQQQIVGIAPVPYRDPRVHPGEQNPVVYDGFIGKLATFASWLDRHSYSLALFSTDLGVDPLAIEDLRTTLQIRHSGVRSEMCCGKSINELVTTMSGMDYVVTCRFHGVVLAHLLNKPVIAISHHPKVATLMHDLGLSRYCVDIERFDGDLLVEMFTSIINDVDDIKRCMADKVTSYRSQLMSQFDALFPDLQESKEGLHQGGLVKGIGRAIYTQGGEQSAH